MNVAMIYREEIKEYDFGPGHPLRGDRFGNFLNLLKERLKENEYYRFETAEPVQLTDLLQICDKAYIDFTTDFFRAANLGQGFDNRFYTFHSGDNMPSGRPGRLEEAARLIIGQAKLAADLVMNGKYEKAFCIGGGTHHARRRYGEGFCIYNDVAFVTTYLLESYNLERILILDTDAHAGNGTKDYFYSNPKVLFIDIHQNPATIYPGTGFANEIGSGDGRGFTINVPLPVDAGNTSYRNVFAEIVEPITSEFKPQIIIRNGGSDPHFSDGLTQLGLTVDGFKMIGEKVRHLAEICGGKEIDLIASGYNAQVLPHCWLALISALAAFPIEVEEPVSPPERLKTDDPLSLTREVIGDIKKYLKDYWQCIR